MHVHVRLKARNVPVSPLSTNAFGVHGKRKQLFDRAQLSQYNKVREYACQRVGRETNQRIWFAVAKQQRGM